MSRSTSSTHRAGVEAWHTIRGVCTFSRAVGAGADVVLVHGAGVSSRYWRPAQRALAARGAYRVHALDLPGFGRSPDPPWPLELRPLAGHLEAWMEAVLPGDCHLVGQSLECEIAALVAAARPDRVRTLTLAAPAGLPALRSIRRQVLRALADAPRESPALYAAVLPDYWRCGVSKLLHMLREQRRCPTHRELHAILAPVLVLRGADDPIVSPGRVAALAAALPRALTATLPGAHAAHFTHPEEFAAEVIRFLEAAQKSGRLERSRCAARGVG